MRGSTPVPTAVQIAAVLKPFEVATRIVSSSTNVTLPQVVNIASELYHATLESYRGTTDTAGYATALSALLLGSVVKVLHLAGACFVVFEHSPWESF